MSTSGEYGAFWSALTFLVCAVAPFHDAHGRVPVRPLGDPAICAPDAARESVSTVSWDYSRTQRLYADNVPIRLVQVLDTHNCKLVAGKPTVVRVYACNKDTGNRTAIPVSAELYMDGVLAAKIEALTYPRNHFKQDTEESRWRCLSTAMKRQNHARQLVEQGHDTMNFRARGGLRPSAGIHTFEVRIIQEGVVVLRKMIEADFRMPARRLTIVKVPVHVRTWFHTRKPDPIAYRNSHTFLQTVYPLASVDVVDVDIPFVMEGSVHGKTAQEEWLRRNELLSRIVTDSISPNLAEHIAAERASGNVVAIVGITPDIHDLFGSQTDGNIRGYAIRYVGACMVKEDRALDFNLAHEVGHLMPLPLADGYRHGGHREHLRHAKVSASSVARNVARRSRERDIAGVFITQPMGAFNLTYESTSAPGLSMASPVISSDYRSSGTIRGFMGAYGTMWVEPTEYAQLYRALVGE